MFPQLLFYISLLFIPFTATWSKSIPNHFRWWDFANIHGKTPREILPVNSNYISYKMLCNWFRVNYRKYISKQQKNPGNLTVPGYLTFGHMYLHDTLIPFYLIFFMVFSPKYSEKQLNCTTYFDLPDFLAPFWHRRILKLILFCICQILLYRLYIAPVIFNCYNRNMGATITVGG